jgi:hypothetical protein
LRVGGGCETTESGGRDRMTGHEGFGEGFGAF